MHFNCNTGPGPMNSPNYYLKPQWYTGYLKTVVSSFSYSSTEDLLPAFTLRESAFFSFLKGFSTFLIDAKYLMM